MFDQTQNYVNPTMGGYNYQGMNAAPMQKFNNTLTAEEIQKLQKKSAEFSLGITQEEWLRGVCNHRSADGSQDTLVIDPLTGEARCTTCGYQFKPIEPNVSIDEIRSDVDRIVDILQTIKLMYVDLPPEAAREYFQIIPLIEKIPQLFEFAAKDMNKHEANMWQYNNQNIGAVRMFNNLQSMFANGMQQPQPMMNQPMMNPMAGPGMPVGTMPQYNANMGGNAFGYPGASAMPQQQMMGQGYQPQNNGFQFVPNAETATTPVTPTTSTPAAPTPEGAAETATVTQNVTV